MKALLCRCGGQETRKLLNLLIAIVFWHSRSVCDKKNSGKYTYLQVQYTLQLEYMQTLPYKTMSAYLKIHIKDWGLGRGLCTNAQNG